MTVAVSVVIPTYNRAADLRRALISIRSQTRQDWEAVIVDNHSTDDTDRVIASFNDSRLRLLKIHNEGVIAKSRNLGIVEAAGEYIAFLDSDDWWTADKLQRSLQVLQGADMVYHDLYLVRSAGQSTHWRKVRTRSLRRPAYDDLLTGGNAITTSSVVVRRDLMRSIDGFSEDPMLVSWEDYDAWLRLSKLTERFVKVDGVHGYYWVGGGNMTSAERTLRNLAQFKRMYIDADPRYAGSPLPAWCHYSLGIACRQLGKYRLAVDHMRSAARGALPIQRRLNALVQAVVCSGRALTSSARA